jgi:hypothetical protein
MIPHLSTFFDPSDAFHISPKSSHECTKFHAENVCKVSYEDTGLNHSNLHYSKALPGKIDYERLPPYFEFQLHDVIRHNIQQTTQLHTSTIHYPTQHQLKVVFKC